MTATRANPRSEASRGAVAVSAPGKAILAGEYSVLEGAPALVTAVDRRVVARVELSSADGPGLSIEPCTPEIVESVRLAQARWGAIDGRMRIDATRLQLDGRKLGLGSSAANAVAAAAAVAEVSGRDLEDPRVRTELLAIALDAHRAVAPEGSGIDVLASVLGGTIRAQRREGNPPTAEAVPWPHGLESTLVWTGQPASSRALVDRVRELRARDRQAYDRGIAPLGEAAEAMTAAFQANDLPGVLAATRKAHRGLAALGHAAAAPLVTPALERVAELANHCGGAAKPSGAGGGDIAIAFFASTLDPGVFASACAQAGLAVVYVAFGAGGGRAEPAPDE